MFIAILLLLIRTHQTASRFIAFVTDTHTHTAPKIFSVVPFQTADIDHAPALLHYMAPRLTTYEE